MEIKEGQKLNPGDIIEYDLSLIDEQSGWNSHAKGKIIKTKLMCMQVFKHHVLFRMIEPPYHKVDIQNVALWQKHIYKDADLKHQINVRRYTTHE